MSECLNLKEMINLAGALEDLFGPPTVDVMLHIGNCHKCCWKVTKIQEIFIELKEVQEKKEPHPWYKELDV